MKKLIISIILGSLISNICLGDCNWSTGITAGPNKTFIYSEACHLQVGKLVQDSKVKDQQLTDLNKAITLKDLALKTSDDRATLWYNTSSSLEDRLQKVDSIEKHSQWLYFGLGVLTTFAAGYVAAQLVRK